MSDAKNAATTPPANVQWEIVREENPDKAVFSDVGDVLIGTYDGQEVITIDEEVDERTGRVTPASTFTVLKWRNATFNGDATEFVSTNAGAVLETAFADITPGTLTRITLIKLTDVGKASKMNDFRVEAAKNAADKS